MELRLAKVMVIEDIYNSVVVKVAVIYKYIIHSVKAKVNEIIVKKMSRV